MIRFSTCAVLAILVALAIGRLAPATTYSWDGNGAVPPNGNFNVANNWNLNTVPPGGGDTAQFNLGGVAYTVGFPGTGGLGLNPVNYVTDKLLVGSTNTVNFAQVSALSTYSVNNATTAEAGRGIIIGSQAGDNATLSSSLTGITGFSGVAATIADVAGATGTLNIIGSKFNLSGNSSDDELIIGRGGMGTLNVTSGATLHMSGASGNAVLGKNAGAHGTATISGAGSNWNMSSKISIGDTGSGTLMITDGGKLTTANVTIAGSATSNSAATVNGTGSTWNCNDSLIIGNRGTAAMSITGGGQVLLAPSNSNTVSNVLVGSSFTGAIGTLTIDGAGSMLSLPSGADPTLSMHMSVGNVSGTGTLSVTNGGVLKTGATSIAIDAMASGTVTVDGAGSTWSSNGNVSLASTGAGSLTVSNGGAVNVTGILNVGPSGTIRGNSTLAGVISSGGIVAPGILAAALQVNGNFNQLSTGKLQIEIGGATAGTQYDQLNVTGAVTLAGTLDVSIINSFLPSGGEQFTVLTASSIVNNGLTLAGSAASSFNLLLSGTSVILQAIGLPGDYNKNGIVDAADYVVWRKTLNQSGLNLPADGDGDGTIDSDDYGVWRSHFGQAAGSGSGASANATIPEPATLVLIIFATAGWCLRRYRAA